MDVRASLFSFQTLRSMFGGSEALLERRVRDLPVMVDRRAGPPCKACGFGTLHTVAAGRENAGKLQCNRPGCGTITEKSPSA